MFGNCEGNNFDLDPFDDIFSRLFLKSPKYLILLRRCGLGHQSQVSESENAHLLKNGSTLSKINKIFFILRNF